MSHPNTVKDDTRIGHRLDPCDWKEYRAQLHQLVDACCDRMESYRDLPWQAPPCDLAAKVAIAHSNNGGHTTTNQDETKNATSGRPLGTVLQDDLVRSVMPYATGNTHPQFFGWVHGAGIPACVAADLVSSTMNANCGGRHHGAMAVEAACIDWLCQTAGFCGSHAETTQTSGEKRKLGTENNKASISTGNNNDNQHKQPFGVLTSGTSQATIFALLAARTRKFGCSTVRQQGIQHLPPVRIYVSQAAHSCLTRAMECLGHGAQSVARIPVEASTGAMSLPALRDAIQQDQAAGVVPLAIVGTAGSVTVGAYDDFEALANIAAEVDAWFHIDAAFGFWIRLSPEFCHLSHSTHRADSMALDAHKWPGVNYECGALLVQDKEHLRQTLAMRPAYLQSATQGLAGGDVWFTDYSLDLSRGFRALKLWTALTVAGTETIGQVISDHCHLARHMGDLVQKSDVLSLAHPVISNVCCFHIVNPYLDNGSIPTAGDVAAALQLEGQGVFSTLALNEKDCLRAAIVNHRTTPEDVEKAIASVEEAVRSRIELPN